MLILLNCFSFPVAKSFLPTVVVELQNDGGLIWSISDAGDWHDQGEVRGVVQVHGQTLL